MASSAREFATIIAEKCGIPEYRYDLFENYLAQIITDRDADLTSLARAQGIKEIVGHFPERYETAVGCFVFCACGWKSEPRKRDDSTDAMYKSVWQAHILSFLTLSEQDVLIEHDRQVREAALNEAMDRFRKAVRRILELREKKEPQ